MDLKEFKAKYYFFDPKQYGKIFIFVDFGNVRPWAKDLWPEENKFKICKEIDIKKLAELCEWVCPKKKLFYYGHFGEREDLDKDHRLNEAHRKSIYRIDRARKSGFAIKTKEIKLIPLYDDDGAYIRKIPKCNFDVEITMSMLNKMEKYDTAMLFSGDSDFGGLLSYLRSKGKKTVVVCTRNRMSRELEQESLFIPAETLANFLPLENKNTPPKRAEV